VATVAFLRAEGILFPRSAATAAAYMASAQQSIAPRLARLGAVLASAPLSMPGLGDPAQAVRLAWAALRGASEDRLVILGEDYQREQIAPRLLPIGLGLLAEAKRQRLTVVLVSEHIDTIVAPIARELGIAHVMCNRMEMRDGRATGRLLDPLVGGHLGREQIARFAEGEGLELTGAVAWGARAVDASLLEAVPRPCAVSPDRTLRQIARDRDWPVMVA
jgi:phosphoserine phosphatase